MNDLSFNQVANIKVFGVGGGGCNAVNRMVSEGVKGVEFYVANTDLQILNISPVENKLVLGREITKGLGAGGDPEMGKRAAQESEQEIREAIKGSDMVFVTTGLGGGTGTGAAPVFAKIAKEEGALTVGIVTKPFTFEGPKRKRAAEAGLVELKQYVDSLIIVSNNNLIEVIGRRPISEAFQAADNVLRQDFADVRSIMQNRGAALIGIGMAEGEDKARAAAEKAIQSPLLEAQIQGARNAIVNITGGESITLFDAEDAMGLIREAAGNEVDAIFGVAINEKLGDSIIVTVIATGFEDTQEEQPAAAKATSFTAPKQTVNTVEDTADDEEQEVIPSFFARR